MNIESEASTLVVAKTCGCSGAGSSGSSRRRITYAFVDQAHALCLDKKQVIQAEIEACEKLAKYAAEDADRAAIEKEISELRMALDLLA